MEVRFYDKIEDDKLKFAVIVSRYQGQWVFCKHKARNTYECPGGHREPGEDIEKTARRELWEETGAEKFDLKRACVYSVADEEGETFGMLYFAEILDFGPMPPMEIEKIQLFDELPTNWTYPEIQPKLLGKVEDFLQHRQSTASMEKSE